MKLLAGIFALLLSLTLAAPAAEKMTEVTIDGTSYVQISDVHVVSGGRIVILFPSGGTTVTPDKLSAEFLASWGITKQELTTSKQAAVREAAQSLDQAIRAGFFREVEGVVYDLRKPQAGWIQFPNAKILQVIEDSALVDPNPFANKREVIFVRNLPRIFIDNQSASFFAKLTGNFSYVSKAGEEHTLRAYDLGRVCNRSQIPAAILTGGQSLAMSATATPKDRAPAVWPDSEGLRGIGSGFFITQDGYLLTNFHVVKDANKVEVKYKNRVYRAKVVEVDKVNDLALLKVPGADFHCLSLAPGDSADLGDPVFTIGFPNIEMQGVDPKYTDGKISSLAGMQDDPTEYQISVPVQPGNSGGPLCNASGEVVGIVVARLNDMEVLRASGAVPQNVNYAVKSKHALKLVQRVDGLEAHISASKRAPRNAKPVPMVEDAIVMVMIY